MPNQRPQNHAEHCMFNNHGLMYKFAHVCIMMMKVLTHSRRLYPLRCLAVMHASMNHWECTVYSLRLSTCGQLSTGCPAASYGIVGIYCSHGRCDVLRHAYPPPSSLPPPPSLSLSLSLPIQTEDLQPFYLYLGTNEVATNHSSKPVWPNKSRSLSALRWIWPADGI